ncbi:MAG: phosphotransferase, partial [Chitinophagaceae bacterium]|nr:phosphotransferase [Anaerolineae bacterium]
MTLLDFHAQDALVQAGRLDVLAQQALNAYGLPDAIFTFAAYTNNAVYRVDDGDERYALRIHRPGHRQLAWIESELNWLAYLSRETPLMVPNPVKGIYTG